MNSTTNDVRVENTNSESLLSKCSLVEQGTGELFTYFDILDFLFSRYRKIMSPVGGGETGSM